MFNTLREGGRAFDCAPDNRRPGWSDDLKGMTVRMFRSTVAMTLTLLVLLVNLQPFCQQAQGDPILLDPQRRTIFGFTTSGVHDPVDIYETPNGWGIAFLDPTRPVHPLTQETLYYNFFNVLNRQFPPTSGWSFVGDARRISDNSLRVHTYDAVGTRAFVGADIDIEYRPTPNTVDPTANMHWIQVVSNNHRIGGRHGDLDNKVDVLRDRTPYYDSDFAANSRNFLDTPRRPDPEQDHDWIAALFLVSGPTTPGRVTIFNHAGILWGWENRFFRNVGVGAFHDRVHDEVLIHLPEEEFVAYHDEFHADLSAVPEPSTATLIGMGVLCLCLHAWRRRRRLPCAG